jgi:hypothetical protein
VLFDIYIVPCRLAFTATCTEAVSCFSTLPFSLGTTVVCYKLNIAPVFSRDLMSHVASLMPAATAKPSPPLCWFGLFGLLKQLGWAHEPKSQLPQSAVTVCSSPPFSLSLGLLVVRRLSGLHHRLLGSVDVEVSWSRHWKFNDLHFFDACDDPLLSAFHHLSNHWLHVELE